MWFFISVLITSYANADSSNTAFLTRLGNIFYDLVKFAAAADHCHLKYPPKWPSRQRISTNNSLFVPIGYQNSDGLKFFLVLGSRSTVVGTVDATTLKCFEISRATLVSLKNKRFANERIRTFFILAPLKALSSPFAKYSIFQFQFF